MMLMRILRRASGDSFCFGGSSILLLLLLLLLLLGSRLRAAVMSTGLTGASKGNGVWGLGGGGGGFLLFAYIYTVPGKDQTLRRQHETRRKPRQKEGRRSGLRRRGWRSFQAPLSVLCFHS